MGSGAAATLVGAAGNDAPQAARGKQASHAGDESGAILVRKLIGATVEGELAGYRTYAHQHQEETKVALDEVLATFARECNLRPSDVATPERIHDSFWYDDGNEPWFSAPSPDSDSGRALTGEPDETKTPTRPPDPSAVLETSFVRACRTRNGELLQRLNRAAEDDPWWSRAAGHHLLRWMRRDPGLRQSMTRRSRHLFHPLVRTDLILDSPLAFAPAPWWDGHDFCLGLLRTLRLDVPSARAAVRFLERLVRRCPGLGLAESDRAIEVCSAVLGLEAEELIHLSTIHARARQGGRWDAWKGYVEYLRVTLSRGPVKRRTIRALGKLWEACPALVATVLRHVSVPGFRTRLRSRLRGAEGEELDDLALALGTQGEPRDGPLLLELLGQRPDSVVLAAAVVRAGDPESSRLARSRWIPRRPDLDALLVRPLISLTREVRSPRLLRELRRQILRAISDPARRDETSIGRQILVFASLGGREPASDPRPLCQACLPA